MSSDNVLREQVKALLGNRCILCTQSNTNLLEIDHRNGNGKKDRERFQDNSYAMWSYYLKPEHHGECRYQLQLLCKNCHFMKSIVAGDYSWRREGQALLNEQPMTTPLHITMLNDVSNGFHKTSLLAELLWYLTRETDNDIRIDKLVKEAIKRGIFVDDFEAQVLIKHSITSDPTMAARVGKFFITRPGYIQLEKRRKFIRKNGELVALNVRQVFNPCRGDSADNDELHFNPSR